MVSACGEPCGRITMAMKLPWSSSGRNDDGRRANSNAEMCIRDSFYTAALFTLLLVGFAIATPKAAQLSLIHI